MSKWRIRIPVYGLQSVLRDTSDELIENKVKFNYRGSEHVGDVIVDSENENDAINDAMYLIDKSLGRICFAYNIEPSMSENASYVTDLSKDTGMEKIRKGLRSRWNYVKENPQITLSKITSLDSDKLEIIDLSFAYYKLSEYDNPLRIESLFSCMTTIVRSLLGRNHVSTSDLKQKIKEILRQTGATFSETEFDNNWEDFYVDERCSIAHGLGSKLVDVRTYSEYEKISSKVSYWTRSVLYHYIDQHKKPKS
ncbi:MAG TPA: hypothetical protein VI037_00005 [Nitrososphaera sp.]